MGAASVCTLSCGGVVCVTRHTPVADATAWAESVANRFDAGLEDVARAAFGDDEPR
jgi:hypothetical protein